MRRRDRERRHRHAGVGALVLDPSLVVDTSALPLVTPPELLNVPETAPFVNVEEGGGAALIPTYSGAALPLITSLTAEQQQLITSQAQENPITTTSAAQQALLNQANTQAYSAETATAVETIPEVMTTVQVSVPQTTTITEQDLLDQANAQAVSAQTTVFQTMPVFGPTTWSQDEAYWTCKFCGSGAYGLSGPPNMLRQKCYGCGRLGDEPGVVVRTDVENVPEQSLSTDSNGQSIFVSINPTDTGVIVNPPVPVVPDAWNFNAAPRTYTQGSQRITTTATYTVQPPRGGVYNTVQGIARTYLNDARYVQGGPSANGWPGGVNKINVANTGFGTPYSSDHIQVGQVLYMPPEAAENAKKLIEALNRPLPGVTPPVTPGVTPPKTAAKKSGLGWTLAGLAAGAAVVGVAMNWDKVKKTMRA